MNESREAVRWRIAGASVRGSSHVAGNLPCQDAHAYRLVGDEWAVVAVADGAGSAMLADVGAQVAVDHAVEALSARLRAQSECDQAAISEGSWHDLLNDVLRSSRAAVEREAAKRGEPVKQLASTLLLMLLGSGLSIAAQVGDGAIVVLGEDGTIEALTLPPTGFSNEAEFLTTCGAVEHAQFGYRARTVTSAAALTDGLLMVAFDYQKRTAEWMLHASFFRDVFQFFEDESDGDSAALDRMLNSPAVRSRTDDDLTLLVVTRESVPATAVQLASTSVA